MVGNIKQVSQKRVWLAIFFAASFSGSAFAQISPFEGLSVVSWTEADKVVGQTAVVYGKIVNVGRAGRVNFLNFDATRRDVFKVVVFEDNLKNFTGPLSELYDDKLVRVKGRVTLYKDLPQIEIASANQIEIVAKLPKSKIVVRKRRKLTKQVRIATFNIRNLFDDVDNPYFADETTNAKPRDELEKLAATINEIDADVVALQEVENRGYLERYAAAFLPDMGYEIVHYSGNDMRSSGLAVMSRIPIGQVVSHRHRRFKDPNGKTRRFSRDLLCVELLHPFAPSFEVWVTHCKSKRGGAEMTEPQRVAETGEISRILTKRIKESPKARILLMGDFNDTLDSNPIRNLLKNGPWKNLAKSLPADSITYNLDPYKAMIDFIFASPTAAAGFVSNSYRIVDQTLSQSGSDHNPVVAEFEFR